MPKTYMPPAISLFASRAPPAIARYQLRLNRRKGRTAAAANLEDATRSRAELTASDAASVAASKARVAVLSALSRIPLKNARGSQISEQMLFQKLSRTLRRLTKASILSYRRSTFA